MYQIIYSSEARKDAKKVNRAGLKNNVLKLIEIVHNNPYQNPPPYEKLLGNLLGSYSRRINLSSL
jgi:Txe/YoeB family toxin of toxin-antitoxin system